MHLRAARRNGLSVDEIKEVLLQTAIYCGVPDANTAFRIAAGRTGRRGDDETRMIDDCRLRLRRGRGPRSASSAADSRRFAPMILPRRCSPGCWPRRRDLDPGAIDEVVWGNANGAGEENRNVGRMAVLLAGLPTSVPATTVNRLCGSSLDAAMIASRTIETGDADVAVAGGVESMTRAPWVLLKPARPFPPGNLDGGLDDAWAGGWSTNGCPRSGPSRWGGQRAAAREVRDLRERQDGFAARSHQPGRRGLGGRLLRRPR